jgi:NADH-quinone oxidoreductase subunit J
MSASAIIFYLIAAFILGSALFAVTTRKIFRSAVQIAVYVGGIVVLIIFSVFLTQQSGKEMPATPLIRKIAALVAVLIGFALTAIVIDAYQFRPVSQPFEWTVATIGSQMLNTGYDGFALPFEVVSMLLLAAMVGCIVILCKYPKEKRSDRTSFRN